MQTILAIETSVPEASIALWSHGKWIYEAEFVSDRNHNSMIFEPLAEALTSLGEQALSCVIVGSGPGSYSGTRIGIAAAQGIAVANACPVAALGPIAATTVARSEAAMMARAGAAAIGDARRGLYYISPITASGEAAVPELMDAVALRQRLTAEPDQVLFTLDDPVKLELEAEHLQRVTATRPCARLLIDVWLQLDDTRREQLFATPLSPSYLRAPFTSKAKQGHPLLRKG